MSEAINTEVQSQPTDEAKAAAAAEAAAAEALKKVDPVVGGQPDPLVVKQEEPKPVSFAPTGDAALDVALDFFAKAGIKPDSVAMTLAQKGDFSVLKADLAAKGKAGWEQYASIAEQAHGRATSAAAAKTAATQSAILAVAGSQESWDAIRAFVGSKSDPGELAEINAALKQGGLAAKATVKYMKDVFLASGQTLPGEEPSTEAVNPNRAQGVKNLGGPLTAAQYSEAVQALSAKIGSGRVEGSAEYKVLKQRRLAGMS